MSEQDYAAQVRDTILRLKKPSYTTTNNKEIRIRCPYCGDSKSNPTSAHLYIEMKAPFRFHCFKCETSGVLNQETFRDMMLFDTELSMNVINANKHQRATSGVQKVSFKKIKLTNNVVQSQTSINSLNYFNNRFNSNYDPEFIAKRFKCILDPAYFFNENKIYVPDMRFEYSNAIGFISADSSHLIFRDYGGQQEKRYNNFNISQNEPGLISKSYNISGEISAMTPEVNLVLAEGIFDIIGVYTHFGNQYNEQNTIFAAACGKGYNAVILNYIRMGFLNLNVIIYSDGDVDQNFYKGLKNNAPYLKNSILTVYYNSLYNPKTKFGKDYGVPKEQIKLRKIIV